MFCFSRPKKKNKCNIPSCDCINSLKQTTNTLNNQDNSSM